MSYTEDARRRMKEIRQRLRRPPNAVIDHGIDLTRKSSASTELPPVPDPAPTLRIRVRVYVQKPILQFTTVMAVVGRHFDVTLEQLRSPNRNKKLTLVRHICIHIGDRLLGRSLCSMGKDMNRHHTSMLHGQRKILRQLYADQALASKVDSICAELGFYARNHRSSTLAALSKSYLAAKEIRLKGQAGLSQPGIYFVDQTGRNPMAQSESLAEGHPGTIQG